MPSPFGGRCPRPRPRTDEGKVPCSCSVQGRQGQARPSSAACGRQLPPEGEAFRKETYALPHLK